MFQACGTVLTGMCFCRNMHPDHCRDAAEMNSTSTEQNTILYDRPAGWERLEGRSIRASIAGKHEKHLLRVLPQLLAEDESKTHRLGWVGVNQDMLAHMVQQDWLTVNIFRQARLQNYDLLSSTLDESQPSKQNMWALVAYEDDKDGYFLCILQILFFARVAGRSSGMIGFDPNLCERFGVMCPDAQAPHSVLRVAVGHLFLATACTKAMGAVGCRESYDPSTGMPPDLVGVRNMKLTGDVICGSGKKVLKSGKGSRYYGVCGVHIDDICCQVGPTQHVKGDPVRCFLVCSKKSSKRSVM